MTIETVSFLPLQSIYFLFFFLPVSLNITFSKMLTKNGKNTHSCLVSDLRGKAFNLSTLSMMLAMDFHGYPIPICMKGCWVESHSFYVSIEMSMYFNSFFLLILHQYNITLVDFHVEAPWIMVYNSLLRISGISC